MMFCIFSDSVELIRNIDDSSQPTAFMVSMALWKLLTRVNFQFNSTLISLCTAVKLCGIFISIVSPSCSSIQQTWETIGCMVYEVWRGSLVYNSLRSRQTLTLRFFFNNFWPTGISFSTCVRYHLYLDTLPVFNNSFLLWWTQLQ